MTDHQFDTTHAPVCWSWGPKHYECALREIETLRAEVHALQKTLTAIIEADCQMTTKIELLPLPEGEASSFGDYQVHDNEAMIEYARANVALNTALLQAENERLRAEVHALRKTLTAMVSWFPSADTYLRLGFDPSAPMEALKEAKAALSKENKDE